MTLYHGTVVEIDGLGILIQGPSGAGKSDLALRLTHDEATLISDDYCDINNVKNCAIVKAPQQIAGKIEAFGIGILDIEFKPQTTLKLVVQLMDEGKIERMPNEQYINIEGVSLPLIHIYPHQASATAKITLFIKNLKK